MNGWMDEWMEGWIGMNLLQVKGQSSPEFGMFICFGIFLDCLMG